jgi:RNA polymerase sigma factor (TIGR02999 family)
MFDQAQITRLLVDLSNGNNESKDKLFEAVYNELRFQASAYLHRERRGHTLQTTDLVHEAYFKLIDQKNIQWQNRAHFFAVVAQAMRRILVDYARGRQTAKRGGGQSNASLDEAILIPDERVDEIVALDEALTRLAVFDERQNKIVELRYFSGLTIEETAEVLGIAPATVKREWNIARAWLYRELSQRQTKF